MGGMLQAQAQEEERDGDDGVLERRRCSPQTASVALLGTVARRYAAAAAAAAAGRADETKREHA
jgi:hypothetical protein